ncbi:hypothetical protein ACIGW0_31295 [Streptomyces bikiniensis]|uniref:Uncharacterized protein n=1 Tax=Streptomyces bikiniensis TaxID=1896 RepID=A0ABW8D492_STRBI
MTAYGAYRIAQVLADNGLTSDPVTAHDMDRAADYANVTRPGTTHDRHTVRLALDTTGEAP